MNLDELKKINNLIIIGHKNLDTDSILSSMLLKNIFSYFNINADYGMFYNDNIDKTTLNLIKPFNYNPVIIEKEDIKKYKYFLVDHNDIKQSINDKSLVVGVIDHHPNSNLFKNIINKKLVSTTAVIYDTFNNIYPFNKKEKNMIYNAIIHDSNFGKSSRYNLPSRKIVKKLGFNPDFTYYFKKYFIPTDITDLNYAFNNSKLKYYEFDDIYFESTALELFNNDYLEEYKDFIKNSDKNILGIYLNLNENKTYVFFKYNDDFYIKNYNYIASRGSKIINDILDLIRSGNEKNI